uniref:Palmitoyltransferase n=1 Tax=Chromera velia CCMP2878 TaxID=1169474 RepID=A0A0G4HN87_9ALVE|eukprot:Cvel_7656.t1-p1 / transcript=Cvel_7656.t1 / gene=Cvel_7656 / organism=Chromera_velia_CCMP2878 / gene_product=Palmitoyltransferase AKR1, putative / transcript_product=Palmitoyltransferase AKR1, putative / location=Cvel_scaffold405:74999-81825(+) / protein_length=880 / sequence_SO=supercontig / SO=protein_coding / is_pseudo=false
MMMETIREEEGGNRATPSVSSLESNSDALTSMPDGPKAERKKVEQDLLRLVKERQKANSLKKEENDKHTDETPSSENPDPDTRRSSKAPEDQRKVLENKLRKMMEAKQSGQASKLTEANEEFWFAARSGDFEKIERALINEPALLTARDPHKHTLLHWFALSNHQPGLQFLFDRDFDVNCQSANGQTPLMWAALRGHLKLICRLKNKGADLNLTDSLGATAAMIAIQHKQLLAFLVLYKLGADMRAGDINGCSVTHWAAFKGEVPFLRVMKYFNFDLSQRDKEGKTPLHRAASNAQTASALWLAKNGNIDIEAEDSDGKKAADLAEEYPSLSKALRSLEAQRRLQSASAQQGVGGQGTSRLSSLVPLARDIETGAVGAAAGDDADEDGDAADGSEEKKGIAGLLSVDGVRRMAQGGSGKGGKKGGWVQVFVYTSFLFGSIFHFHSAMNGGAHLGWLSSLFQFLYPIVLVYYACLLTSDPGTIPKRDIGSSAMEELLEQVGRVESASDQEVREIEKDLSALCMTCWISKPLRTKHCAQCDKCVEMMDHHCGFLNTCVGRKTHRYFVVFCFLQQFAQIVWGILLWKQLSLVAEEAGHTEGWFSSMFFFLLNAPITSMIFAYNAFNVTWHFVLLYDVVRGISVNLLVNEAINIQRYSHFHAHKVVRAPDGIRIERIFSNPFDMGRRENCLRFWNGTRDATVVPTHRRRGFAGESFVFSTVDEARAALIDAMKNNTAIPMATGRCTSGCCGDAPPPAAVIGREGEGDQGPGLASAGALGGTAAGASRGVDLELPSVSSPGDRVGGGIGKGLGRLGSSQSGVSRLSTRLSSSSAGGLLGASSSSSLSGSGSLELSSLLPGGGGRSTAAGAGGGACGKNCGSAHCQ